MTTFNTKFAKLRKTTYIASVSFLITGMIACGNPSTEYTSDDSLPDNMGIVTEVKEMKEDVFRITEETVVPLKTDSRIIAEYMNGTRDTFTLQEAQLTDAENPKRNRMSGILMGGMMGYMMGRSPSTPINRASYASDDAFRKSSSSNQVVRAAATQHRAKTTGKGKSGYGAKKSTRSYGG